MNWREDLAGESRELGQALEHFKASMDAWSDAALRRPRTVTEMAARRNWRLAASWALGSMLVAGTLAGAVYQVVHRQEMAKQAAQTAAANAGGSRARGRVASQRTGGEASIGGRGREGRSRRAG